MTTGDPPPPLATRLRQALQEKGYSQRQLAKLIAAETGLKEEHERRQLLRHLAAENTPDDDRARLYARLLDKPDDYFIDDRPARAQLVDQIHGMVALIDDLRAVVEERFPERAAGEAPADPLLELALRLEALEGAVDGMAQATAESLSRLEAAIGRLSVQLQTPAARGRA